MKEEKPGNERQHGNRSAASTVLWYQGFFWEKIVRPEIKKHICNET
jgi:hypothetical protein